MAEWSFFARKEAMIPNGLLDSRFLVTFTTEGVISGLKMYVVDSRGGAIACMLLALIFLGTWPAILTLLERRGRLPQHTYLDYTITNLLAAVIITFTFGEFGHTNDDIPNFLVQLSQNNWPSVLFAMGGGVVLSLSNLSTQYAWAFVGLSVTTVICSSITVVIGTTLNYFLDERINRAEILFPGVACFLIAVCFGSVLHTSNAKDNEAKLDKVEDPQIGGKGSVSNGVDTNSRKDLEYGSGNAGKANTGTANFLIELESRRAIKVFGKSTLTGLAICLFSGLCCSLFTPLFNLATNDQWHTLEDGVPHLSVYTTFFYFSCSCFVIAIILNITFLYHPMFNLPRSSINAYLNDWDGRGWAFLAGFLCGFGNGLQFMGGQAAGYAAADAVQALPLVSTFWGVLLFGEYHKSSRRTYVLLIGMLSMFVVAVGLLMASSGHRKINDITLR
ncbi:ureide permease 1-like protein [Tanacetum coccineum]